MMSDFDSLREQLAGIRAQRDSAQRETASAGEQLDRLKRDYVYLSRVADPQTGAQQEQLQALQARIAHRKSDMVPVSPPTGPGLL